MFGRKIRLFRIFGFAINIDISWFILAFFIMWSLAKGLFPFYFSGFSNEIYWRMAAAGMLGLFVSIIFHELCHSIVAVRYGMPMKGITLFIFGGVAEMSEEPPSAKAEFLMAIAGPISSVLLGAGLYFVRSAGERFGWPVPVNGVLSYLVWLNFTLAAFNMLPAFPLDGGRVLRSILWSTKKNIRWATRISSRMGTWFGMLIMAIGIVSIFTDNLLGGAWWFLIGMFLKNASQMSYQQLLMRRGLEGEPVSRFMISNPVTVPASVSIAELVENYFYKYHFRMFPVVDGAKLIGCVTSRQVPGIPREQWGQHTAAELAKPCAAENTVRPDMDAMKALSLMSSTGNGRLMVVDGNALAGVITLKDMLKFLALKVDFEGEKN